MSIFVKRKRIKELLHMNKHRVIENIRKEKKTNKEPSARTISLLKQFIEWYSCVWKFRL